jgi:hypothetical protein
MKLLRNKLIFLLTLSISMQASDIDKLRELMISNDAKILNCISTGTTTTIINNKKNVIEEDPREDLIFIDDITIFFDASDLPLVIAVKKDNKWIPSINGPKISISDYAIRYRLEINQDTENLSLKNVINNFKNFEQTIELNRLSGNFKYIFSTESENGTSRSKFNGKCDLAKKPKY